MMANTLCVFRCPVNLTYPIYAPGITGPQNLYLGRQSIPMPLTCGPAVVSWQSFYSVKWVYYILQSLGYGEPFYFDWLLHCKFEITFNLIWTVGFLPVATVSRGKWHWSAGGDNQGTYSDPSCSFIPFYISCLLSYSSVHLSDSWDAYKRRNTVYESELHGVQVSSNQSSPVAQGW